MQYEEIRAYCLDKQGAMETFPFGDGVAVMKIGNKMFALLSHRDGISHISLKCEPDVSEVLREQYAAIKPGYHLNKRHWNTVELDETIPAEEIIGMVDRSYNLVFKSLKKAEREAISAFKCYR
ncbi:MmcQ/YjbR family DNA-binding protein [Aneurinibacillus aneurinilyticus]|uniref:MmcQ/YjbR family DNA-binding protein n=1 Tax=Aneurinibacillus aneurinilyticus TaxID=1391 RepID=UPI0023F910F1|nr:MmcQ/YjbR family DNA-binding protein [Aneurinibacillus aneurinilyticus]